MSSSAVSGLVFVVLICGALLGALVRNAVHSSTLDQGSQEIIKLGTGLLGTLAALVLGLLIASAKGSYDTQLAQVRKLTGDVVLLDFLLAQYGPDAHAARALLRNAIPRAADIIWRENSSDTASRGPFRTTAAGEDAFAKIQELAPQNDAQRAFKGRAIDVSTDLVRTRAFLFEQVGTAIPTPFLAVLIFWLAIIFMSFSLFAKLNPTVIVVLVILALSVSGAIFLMLDLSQPFTGALRVSSVPLRSALAPLGP
jgi:hypothetical protein